MSTFSENVQQTLDDISQTGRTSGDARVLPEVPSSVSRTVQNFAKTPTSPVNNRGSNGYGPFFQEYSLMAEYNQLMKHPIPGLYAMPWSKSPLVWSGFIFVRQGLYQGAALRFTLTIPENYPDGDCPSFVFEHPVFHPLVNPETGELDVKRAFPRWRRNVNHLWQVLIYAKKIFFKIETNIPSNPEAGILYDQEPDLFKSRVAESVEKSKERIYQPPDLDDSFALRFSPWNDAVHPDVRKQMVQSSQKRSYDGDRSANPSDLGLSWMEPGLPEIFSKEDSKLL